MPPLCKVATLIQLSANAICDLVSVAVQVGQYAQNLSNFSYYSCVNLPSHLRERILNIFINTYGRRTAVLLRGLEILLDGGTKELILDKNNTDLWFQDCLRIYLVLQNCRAYGLETLRLYSGRLISFDLGSLPYLNAPLHRTLCNLKNIRNLTLEFIADNTILKLIGQHCHTLQCLDVSYSWAVNDEGIRSLCEPSNVCVSTLHSINLQETGVSLEGILHLLESLPCLHFVETFWQDKTISLAVCLLHNKHPQLKLSLQRIHDTSIDKDKLQVIHTTCPNLKTLTLSCHVVSRFPSFSFLSTVSIDFINQREDCDLEAFFMAQGSTLRNLTLSNQKSSLDMSLLLLHCFSLEYFSGKVCGSISSNSKSLIYLEDVDICPDSCSTLVAFTGQCPAVRRLILRTLSLAESEEDLSSRIMSEVLSRNCLRNLEEFEVVGECSLGVETVEMLLLFCDRIRKIGRLTFWNDLGVQQVTDLKKTIKQRNWDVTLL